MISEHLLKSVCDECEKVIRRGEDRVVVMAVEMRGAEGEEPGGRADTHTSTFCMLCIHEMPKIELPNLWKAQSDQMARVSTGTRRAGGDAMEHATSMSEIADQRRVRKDQKNQSDEEVLGRTLSDPQWRDTTPPNENEMRSRVFNMVYSPNAKKLGNKEMRQVAALWGRGFEQTEIGDLLEISQATVSRRVKELLKVVQN